MISLPYTLNPNQGVSAGLVASRSGAEPEIAVRGGAGEALQLLGPRLSLSFCSRKASTPRLQYPLIKEYNIPEIIVGSLI